MTGPAGFVQSPLQSIITVQPDSPVENTDEIIVDCDVVNNSGGELKGELRLNGGLNGVRANLPNDRTHRRFTLRGVAPAAGSSIAVDYYPDGSPSPTNTAASPLNTRARFDLV